MTFAEWRTLVRLAYQGGTPTQASLLRCVTDGARAVMARDIESDLALAKSYRDSFQKGIVKVAGTRIETDLAATITAVSALMPIDTDTVASQAIQENAIEMAYDDVNAMADKWDQYLLQAAIDLQRHVPFYQVRQMTTFLEDTAGVTTEGFISRVALPENARIQNLTFGRYYAELEADVEYEADDKVMSNGRVYKVIVGGTLTAYELIGGLTSTNGEDEELGDLTFQYYLPERDWPMRQMDWSARNRLMAGEFASGPVYVFPPQSDEIWLYPALSSLNRFDLEWVGVTQEFTDYDEVLFDRTAAEAAAQYILSKMQQSELNDLRASAAALALYQLEVRKAVVDNNDRDTGSPTQVQPYDYRRRCWFWGNCCAPLTVNPGSGGMDINGEIALTNASGTTTIRPTAHNFTVALAVTGESAERSIVLNITGIARGDRCVVIATFESAGVDLTFFNSNIDGAEVASYTSSEAGEERTLQFYFNGSIWVYLPA